jgi:hypothetical protein
VSAELLKPPAELFKECQDFEKMDQSLEEIRQTLKPSAIAFKTVTEFKKVLRDLLKQVPELF